MRDSDLVDFAFVGEGERCLVDIANFYRHNDSSITIEKIEELDLTGVHKVAGKEKWLGLFE